MVRTPTTSIGVSGTSFNVWARENMSTVIVEEGQVSVQDVNRIPNDGVVLLPDQRVIHRPGQEIAPPEAVDAEEAPGAVLSPNQIARLAGGLPALLGFLAVYALWTSWENMDRAYRNNELFKPMPITAVANLVAGVDRYVRITPASNERGNPSWHQTTPFSGPIQETTTTSNLQNGYRMVWDNPEVV